MRVEGSNKGFPDRPPLSPACGDFRAGRAMVVLETISPSMPERAHDIGDIVLRIVIEIGRDFEQQRNFARRPQRHQLIEQARSVRRGSASRAGPACWARRH